MKEPERLSSKWEKLRSTMRWCTKCEALKLRDMSDKHLLNCISLIKSRAKQNKWWGYSSTFWLLCLNNELNRRRMFTKAFLIELENIFPHSSLCKDMAKYLRQCK